MELKGKILAAFPKKSALKNTYQKISSTIGSTKVIKPLAE